MFYENAKSTAVREYEKSSTCFEDTNRQLKESYNRWNAQCKESKQTIEFALQIINTIANSPKEIKIKISEVSKCEYFEKIDFFQEDIKLNNDIGYNLMKMNIAAAPYAYSSDPEEAKYGRKVMYAGAVASLLHRTVGNIINMKRAHKQTMILNDETAKNKRIITITDERYWKVNEITKGINRELNRLSELRNCNYCLIEEEDQYFLGAIVNQIHSLAMEINR